MTKSNDREGDNADVLSPRCQLGKEIQVFASLWPLQPRREIRISRCGEIQMCPSKKYKSASVEKYRCGLAGKTRNTDAASLAVHTHEGSLGDMHLIRRDIIPRDDTYMCKIFRPSTANTFYNWDKYFLQFGQITFEEIFGWTCTVYTR